MTGIEFIVRDRTTGHPLSDIAPKPKPKTTRKRSFSDEAVREIRALAAGGMMQKDIAVRFHVSPGTIGHIVKRECYIDVE